MANRLSRLVCKKLEPDESGKLLIEMHLNGRRIQRVVKNAEFRRALESVGKVDKDLSHG